MCAPQLSDRITNDNHVFFGKVGTNRHKRLVLTNRQCNVVQLICGIVRISGFLETFGLLPKT